MQTLVPPVFTKQHIGTEFAMEKGGEANPGNRGGSHGFLERRNTMIPVRVERRRNVPGRLAEFWGDANMMTDFDRFFERVFGDRQGGGWYPADVWEDEESLHIELEMPGFKSEDVQLSYEAGILRVEAEKKPTEAKGQYHISERRYGKFVRAFQLPNVIDPESINASFRDGVLNISLSKKPETKARKIEIKPG